MSGGVPAGELLPCPFCGGAGDIESQPSYSQAANTYARYRGWCDQCGFGLDWHGDETDATIAWNTRATPTPPSRDADVEREVAYLYEGDDGSRELLFDCNGELAQSLLALGYTETPLFARAALQALGERG